MTTGRTRRRGFGTLTKAFAIHFTPFYPLGQELPPPLDAPDVVDLAGAEVLSHGDKSHDNEVEGAGKAFQFHLLEGQGAEADEGPEGKF